MDSAKLEQLRRCGTLRRLPSGEEAVSVAIHDPQRFAPNVSRGERRAALRQRFEQLARDPALSGSQLDMASLSVLGQSIEAIIPVATFDEACAALAEQRCRVTVQELKQLVR